MYGLTPAGSHPPKLTPTLNPVHFDKHAAYRFSIAFQCVVNIGVRGSEPIRSRVVQAGALNVVGCILEAWLANKGFPVGPKAYSAGHVRESREQRHARRVAREQELKQREEAAELDRALQRSIRFNQRRNIPEVGVMIHFFLSFLSVSSQTLISNSVSHRTNQHSHPKVTHLQKTRLPLLPSLKLHLHPPSSFLLENEVVPSSPDLTAPSEIDNEPHHPPIPMPPHDQKLKLKTMPTSIWTVH
jgi:hypothetical protein